MAKKTLKIGKDFEIEKDRVRKEIAAKKRTWVLNDEPVRENCVADFERRSEEFQFGQRRQEKREAFYGNFLEAVRDVLRARDSIEATCKALDEFETIKDQHATLAWFYDDRLVSGKAGSTESLVVPGHVVRWLKGPNSVHDNFQQLMAYMMSQGNIPTANLTDDELLAWLKKDRVKLDEQLARPETPGPVTSYVRRV